MVNASNQKSSIKNHQSTLWPWLLLLTVTLIPRLWRIGHYLTPDEVLSMQFARNFVAGLSTGDSSLLLGLGYPGVVPVWAHGLGLLGLFWLTPLGIG